jgi:uncharacterized protein
VTGPRWLYLHGFGSGPESAKGRALAAYYANRGVSLERLDLRRPSREHLRLSAMIEEVTRALGGPRDRGVVFGSSLGGLTACRVAERDARVSALVLLAPAFRIVERWRTRLGDDAWSRWRATGWLEVDDHMTGGKARIDFGFPEDAERIDGGGDGWPDVRVPTLIVHGARDEVVDVELSRDFARGKRHVRLVEVDDGHDLLASIDRIQRESEAFLLGYLHGSSPVSVVGP